MVHDLTVKAPAVQLDLSGGGGAGPTVRMPAEAVWGKDSMSIDVHLQLPHVDIAMPQLEHKVEHRVDHTVEHRVVHAVEPRQPRAEAKKKNNNVVQKRTQNSKLSSVFQVAKCLEPAYFQSFDCVGFPGFLTGEECRRIIAFAEEQGFSKQKRHRLLNLQWSDIVDPFFTEALWRDCGLDQFIRRISIDGMVACGLNDVVRIQKFVPGSAFGRHTDQNIQRVDGRISKYSLRIFLNSPDDRNFDGGLSLFHAPFRLDPVVVEPETGLALLYPQGDLATVQEEGEVLAGCKYVLRADVLFIRP